MALDARAASGQTLKPHELHTQHRRGSDQSRDLPCVLFVSPVLDQLLQRFVGLKLLYFAQAEEGLLWGRFRRRWCRWGRPFSAPSFASPSPLARVVGVAPLAAVGGCVLGVAGILP